MMLKKLQIDDKWAIMYNPNENDRPMYWSRYGNLHSVFIRNDAVTAMFYVLLKKQQEN